MYAESAGEGEGDQAGEKATRLGEASMAPWSGRCELLLGLRSLPKDRETSSGSRLAPELDHGCILRRVRRVR